MQKERLHQLYVEQNLSVRDIAAILKISAPTVRYWMRRHGIPSRTISQGMHQKSSSISKRSKEYWSNPDNRTRQSDKLKAVQAGRKILLSQSAKMNWKRNRETFLKAIKKRSADRNYRHKLSASVKESWTDDRRSKQSLIAKSLWANHQYVIKRTVAHKLAMSDPKVRAKLSESSKALHRNSRYKSTIALGVSKTSRSPNSILEEVICRLLADRKVDHIRQKAFGPYDFDIFIPEKSILIECMGNYWHSLPNKIVRDRQRRTYFERYLKPNGHQLFYIWEHQFYGIGAIDKLLSTVLSEQLVPICFSFKSVVIKPVDGSVALKFFDAYHYLDRSRSGLHFGAFIGDDLVACTTFSGLTRVESARQIGFDPDEVIELSRFCIRSGYNQRNFASWFMKKVLKRISGFKAAISFCEASAGHDGTIYRASNWKLVNSTKSSYWYVDEFGNTSHKKSVWNNAKRLSMPERDYAAKYGLYKVMGGKVDKYLITL